MMAGLSDLPRLCGSSIKRVDLGMDFTQAATRFSHLPGTVVLLSGTGTDCARYQILGIDPWLELRGWHDRLTLVALDQTIPVDPDPFETLSALLAHFDLADAGQKDPRLPLATGLLGYFAYDLKDKIEVLPRTCMDTGLPDICLFAPSLILIQDIQTDEIYLSTPVFEKEHPFPDISNALERFWSRLNQPCEDGRFSVDARGFSASFTKAEYVKAVNRIIGHLKAGDIYQANLSQRFETGFKGDAFALLLKLFRKNPAAFFSYVNAGDHKIVSTSPERFVKLEGKTVETRPIKGTIARGSTPKEDDENGKALCNSIKDNAELTMIVDLMRNDLSRVCVADTVEVVEHKRLEPYDNVFHLVSVVSADLQADKNAVDLLKATFPGGSITGCPKIRSMEIIDELEPVKRHVYTGSIGYVSFHGTMDLSIAIRTATILNQTLFFSVGGGVVFDSDPQKEYQETLDKGKTLLETLSEASSNKVFSRSTAWVNGKLVDADKAKVSALGRGFQYGAGLFETLLVDRGRQVLLADHLARMADSWEELFDIPGPDITWHTVIDLLVRENSLENKKAAVKLMLSPHAPDKGRPFFAAAFIRPYVHRLEMLGKEGLDLVTYPYPREILLAGHKTLNYFYYDLAGRFAKTHGADEALILNPDGTISETNTCNLMIIDQKNLILPVSEHVLPGVMQKILINAMARQGFQIVHQKIPLKKRTTFSNLLATNSLMGVVKIRQLDGNPVAHEPGVYDTINAILTDTGLYGT